jgi:prolyl-tRNA synthetase
MKMSNLFGKTLREVPAEAEAASYRLLLRSGFIRQLGTGIYSYLHLAKRSMTRIENILRQEMDAIGGQEITMPVVHPAEIWKETGRWYQIGPEMGRFQDKDKRDMVLAMTHEEVLADLTRREIHSYKQLPCLLYHIQTKWRDEPRARAGLIRVREFTMKDSYSLDADYDGLDKQYRAHYGAYFKMFQRCGLPVIAVKSDVGMMGGKMAHEFMYLAPIGEDTLIICDQCGYTANRQVAGFKKIPAAHETPESMEKVATPGTSTIEDLAKLLNIPKSKTAKAIFFTAAFLEDEQEVSKLVFAVVRGDMEANETKLANALNARDLRPAHDEEILQAGAVPGYASPVGLNGVLVVADDMVPHSPNLVAGANEEGYHLLNVNYGRDYEAGIVADIALAEAGHACPECGAGLRASRGVEVGNIFKLGTRYSDSLDCTYLDRDGKSKPVIMGSYGIGVGRLLACIAEEHHDEHGLLWPISVAPYPIHLVALKGGKETADDIYATLQKIGCEVLYDDRDETPGVKFKDADLIGIPVRLTVSERSLQKDCLEMKLRREKEMRLVPLAETAGRVQSTIENLTSEIEAGLKDVPYRD